MTKETALTRIPENLSFVQPTKYTFVIPDLPFARYQCQAVNIPGVSTEAPIVENPFSQTYRHGDKMMFEPLSITFIVDEDLRVWEETFNWLTGITYPNKFEQYRKKETLYQDGILTINSNANIPTLRIKFTDCHPIGLTSIAFDTRSNADEVLTATAQFRYDTFSFDR